ncbi:hypothetical protein JQC67_07845 [Aurantibacter crassamenti]|uniref:hypothetical protein n=1 Tax=Aurantibacter crassamenti TaxID=1837375 RepID=UPI001939E717|nr:hypothetical protein [Aurantibacter crassamenti]MBM1106044.1 hypothetical protein [Aurantibacter crassamenti]
MRSVKIYHTVDDQGDPDYIENNVPFKSNSENCWAGVGYYFWENYIEHAHWWGKTHYKDNYVICGCTINIEERNCFDIYGNTAHLEYLEKLRDKLTLVVKKSTITLESIIEYASRHNLFPYTIVRMAEGNKSNLPQDSTNLLKIKNTRNPSFLVLKPKLVLFMRDPAKWDLSNLKIEFPDKYVEGYLG